MEDIALWLASNRPYSTGVALYLKYGRDPLLRRLFQEGYSEFKYKKLQQSLEQLLPGTVTISVGNVNTPPVSVTNEVKSDQHLREELSGLQDLVEDLENEKEDLTDQVYDLESEVEDLREENGELQEKVKEIRKGWPAVVDAALKPLHEEWLKLFSEKKHLQSRLYEVAKAGHTDRAKKEEAGAIAHRILDLRDACRKIYQKRDYYLQHHKLPEEKPLMELPTDPKRREPSVRNYKKYIRSNKALLRDNPDHPTAQKLIDKYEWAVRELEGRLGYTVKG